MTPFEDLIHELGRVIDIRLNPDSHQSCLIVFPEHKTKVQIDLDTNADRILIGADLGQVMVGPYRDKLFTQALKVNGLSQVRRGILAFSDKNDSLVLFQFLPISELNGQKLADFLAVFLDHASLWAQAIERGDIPQIEGESETVSDSGLYGTRP